MFDEVEMLRGIVVLFVYYITADKFKGLGVAYDGFNGPVMETEKNGDLLEQVHFKLNREQDTTKYAVVRF